MHQARGSKEICRVKHWEIKLLELLFVSITECRHKSRKLMFVTIKLHNNLFSQYSLVHGVYE